MKKIILSAVALFCLPLFSLADEPTNVITTTSTPTPPQTIEVGSETEDQQNVQMHCVFATCIGTVCSARFSDPEVAIDFIEKNDHCYEDYK